MSALCDSGSTRASKKRGSYKLSPLVTTTQSVSRGQAAQRKRQSACLSEWQVPRKRLVAWNGIEEPRGVKRATPMAPTRACRRSRAQVSAVMADLQWLHNATTT
jgi:hypothetical protein